MSAGEKLWGYVYIIRPINSAMTGVAVFVGALAVGFELSQLDNLLMAIATASSISAASMVVNDVLDREVDAVNAPWRPIPRGLISAREAWAYAFALSALGVFLAFLTSLACGVFASLVWSASVSYSAYLKKAGLLGNAVVSLCVAASFVYGGLATSGVSPLLLVFALIAFFVNLGREVAKGIADVEGDVVRGVRTVAIAWGEKSAATLSAACCLTAVALSAAPAALGWTPPAYAVVMGLADALVVASCVALLRAPTKEVSLKVKKLILAAMGIGMVAFVLGGCAP